MKNVVLRDKKFGHNYHLKLSEEQYRLLVWLDNEDVLRDVSIEVFDNYEFEEI